MLKELKKGILAVDSKQIQKNPEQTKTQEQVQMQQVPNQQQNQMQQVSNEHIQNMQANMQQPMQPGINAGMPQVMQPMQPVRARLTNPEQALLNMLFNEDNPLSYEQIASKTGKSINTIRVIMNSLKKEGLIEENMLPSGVKLFNISNKERIKKIYNLQ